VVNCTEKEKQKKLPKKKKKQKWRWALACYEDPEEEDCEVKLSARNIHRKAHSREQPQKRRK
jgi:hypothetical protein